MTKAMEAEDLYCELYVDTSGKRDVLVSRLSGRTGSHSSYFDVAVAKNGYSESPVPGDAAFLSFDTLVEIIELPTAATDPGGYKHEIGVVMIAIADMGFPVVASCNFDEELPGGGKILTSAREDSGGGNTGGW